MGYFLAPMSLSQYFSSLKITKKNLREEDSGWGVTRLLQSYGDASSSFGHCFKLTNFQSSLECLKTTLLLPWWPCVILNSNETFIRINQSFKVTSVKSEWHHWLIIAQSWTNQRVPPWEPADAVGWTLKRKDKLFKGHKGLYYGSSRGPSSEC